MSLHVHSALLNIVYFFLFTLVAAAFVRAIFEFF